MLLRLFRAVFGAALAPFLHADRVERAADYVKAHSGQILDAAAADQHHRVLLQIVPDPRNVGVDLIAVGEPHARDLAQRRVGLLGRSGLDLRAHAALLRRALQGRRAHLVALLDARLANQLVDSRHVVSRDCITPGAASLTPRLFSQTCRKNPARSVSPSRLPTCPRGQETALQTNPPRADSPLG